jgi:hypothetical protein
MRTRVLALSVLALAVGCAHAATVAHPARSSSSELGALVTNLRSQGASVKVKGPVSEPFFSASGTLLTVNGQEIRVMGFGTSAAATEAASAVATDGYSIGSTEHGLTTISQVDWVDMPHFYRKGSLIAIYVGKDTGTTLLLSQVMGTSFAGGP